MGITDEDFSNFINLLYRNGDYCILDLNYVIDKVEPKMNLRDRKLFQTGLLNTGFVEEVTRITAHPIHGELYNEPTGIFQLTDEGILKLKEYGTYLNYFNHKKKSLELEEKKIRRQKFWSNFSTLPKRFWPLSAFGAFLIVLVPLLFPLICDSNKSRPPQQTQGTRESISDTTKVRPLKP